MSKLIKKVVTSVLALTMAFSVLVVSACGGHTHEFSQSWEKDATHHWHKAICEHSEEVSGRAEHNWNEGVETTAPTCEVAGVKTYTCEVCGQTKTEEITATGHDFSQTWSFDDTHHWHVCLNGCNTDDGKVEHDFDGLGECVCGKTEEIEVITEPNTVRTTNGYLRGYYNSAEEVYSFRGVQYAEATERFVRAGKVEPWDGIREATTYGTSSYQANLFGGGAQAPGPNNSNNCQNLNIYTPEINGDAEDGRPVMVWLHGGGFSTGSGNDAQYDGTNLAADHDVVLVSVTHRLNMFAFFDLSQFGGKYEDSANVGMWDVIDALQWIQDNIAAFGGDPDNVTIFGQSGGGAKVLTLMSSPDAAGLFHKGIVQSGATDTNGPTFLTQAMSDRITEEILDELNLDASNIENVQTMEVVTLLNAGANALQTVADEFEVPAALMEGAYQLEWMPVIDGDFLPTAPVTEDGFAESARNIPLLIGTNLNEWSAMMGMMGGGGTPSQELQDAFQAAYPNEEATTETENWFGNTTTTYGVNNVDTMIRLPSLKIMMHKDAQANDGNGGASIYSYIYAASNSAHGAEVSSVFANVNTILGIELAQAWVNFARNGVPSATTLPTWEPYTRAGGACMILDDSNGASSGSYMAYNHDSELLELLEPNYEYFSD